MAQLRVWPYVVVRIMVALLALAALTACSTDVSAAKPTPTAQEIRGGRLFEANCSRCHGTVGTITVVGPSLAGVASRAGQRIAGMDAQAYIRSSIEEPGAYTVEGFPEGIMPATFKTDLLQEDLEAIVAFLLTLE